MAPQVPEFEPTPERFKFRRGAQVGRYVLIEALGRGGMGKVVLCYDPELDRRVALKILDPRTVARAREQVLTEARATARLVHPNVVVVHDVGCAAGVEFIAMELAEGGNLWRWQKGKPAPREILRVYRAAGEGLAAAHRAGMVHRDFKPANVLLGADGRPRVADFGLAKPAGGPFATGGTPGYMAPEQQREGQADPRSDQYSFCVSLWEALSGVRPDAHNPPESWGRLPAGISPRVRRALVRGLSLRPERRFPDMPSLLAELAEERRGRRHHLRLAAAAATVVGAAVGAGSLLRGDPCAPTSPWLDQAAQPAISAAGPAFSAPLQRWGRSWSAAHREACLAGPSGAAGRECLERARQVALALLDRAGEASPDLASLATRALFSLPAPARCSPHLLLEPAPAAEGVFAEATARLARAQVLLETGAALLAREEADRVADASQASAALKAEALYLRGRAEWQAGELAAARASLRSAATAADASGRDLLRLRADLSLARLSLELEQPGEAEPWLHAAAAALPRAGAPPEESAEVAELRGMLSFAQGDLEGARRALSLVEASLQQQVDESHPALARVRAAHAWVLALSGCPAEAEALAEHALAQGAPVLPPLHPDTIRARVALALARGLAGRPAEAARALEGLEGWAEQTLADRRPEIRGLCAWTRRLLARSLRETGGDPMREHTLLAAEPGRPAEGTPLAAR